jgi:hypothetical protein
MKNNGALDMILTRQSNPFGENISELYFAQAQSALSISSTPNLLSIDQATEARIEWTKYLAVNDQLIHIFWQVKNPSGLAYVFHQYSLDGGATFERLTSIQRFSETINAIDAYLDYKGQPNLVLVDGTSEGNLILRHQVFEEFSWKLIEEIDIASNAKLYLREISAAVAPDGQLGVLVSDGINPEGFETDTNILLFLRRLPSEVVTLGPVDVETLTELNPTPAATAATVETLPSEPTPEPFSLSKETLRLPPRMSPFGLDPLIWSVLIGGGISIVFIVFSLVRQINAPRTKKDR